MDSRTAPTLRRSRLLVAAVAAVASLCAMAGVASAHDDKGVMEVTQAAQTGPTTVHLEVGIVYEGDGHLAEDAVVSATLTRPDGTTTDPVALTRVSDTSSLYAADVQVDAPGSWSAVVTSTGPQASSSSTFEVAATPATDDQGATDTASTLLEEDEPEFTATTEVDREDPADDTKEDLSDANGGFLVSIVLVGTLLVVLLAVAGLRTVRRRGAGSAQDHTHDGPPPPDQMPPAV